MRLRTTSALLAVVLAVALAVSGCASAAEPSPSPSPPGLWLSASMRQAIPPVGRFSWLPSVAITSDGVLLTQGAVPAIFPGPLVTPISGRAISGAGMARILDAAAAAGLLAGQTDFTGGGAMPGAPLGVLRLTVEGRVVELVGDLTLPAPCEAGPCNPQPGTQAAFAAYWYRLHDLAGWLADDLGPEGPWEPPGYALLVGPAPDPQDLPQRPLDWPLAAPLATMGGAAGDGIHRCATIVGEDAAVLRPALQAANALTPWIQDPETSASFGLVVRPLLPGEDVCAELFGGGS